MWESLRKMLRLDVLVRNKRVCPFLLNEKFVLLSVIQKILSYFFLFGVHKKRKKALY